MAHGFRYLLGGGTNVEWASLNVRARFLRGADNLYWEANHFKNRYGMNTISCPSESSWTAYYWAKNMVLGILHLQNQVLAHFPEDEEPTASELLLFLRGVRFEERLLESPVECTLVHLDQVLSLLAEWVERGLPEEGQPSRDWIG